MEEGLKTIVMDISKYFLAVIFLTFVTPCLSDDAVLRDEVEVHLASYHFSESRDDDFEEFNYGAGYNFAFKENAYAVIGAFNNSYGKGSVYGGVKWIPIDKKFFKAGFVAGVVTGYDEDTDANEVQPIIIPEAQFHYKQLYLVTRIAPDLGDNSSAAITFSIGYRLPAK